MKPKVFVTAEWPETGHQALAELGFRVAVGGWGTTGRPLGTQALAAAAAGASVLIVEVEEVTSALLDRLPGLTVVGAARGVPSNVDVAACTRRRIPVLHAPARNAESVADFTLGLIVACCRGISAGERHLRTQGWLVGDEVPYRHFRGPELAGRTLGLIGCGAVGERVAARAALGLGMRVIHSDPDRPSVPHSTVASLPGLLRSADVVSLHCARSAQTAGLIGAPELAAMKPGSYLINTAGGGMVDESALVAALKQHHLAGAALDVFATEPLPPDSPLRSCPDLMLTPHLAGAASDVPAHHARLLCDDLARLSRGQPPRHCANGMAIRAAPVPARLSPGWRGPVIQSSSQSQAELGLLGPLTPVAEPGR